MSSSFTMPPTSECDLPTTRQDYSPKASGFTITCLGRSYGDIQGIYRDNGTEHGNCCLGLRAYEDSLVTHTYGLLESKVIGN